MRHLSLALLASTIAAATAVGCYTGSPVDSYLADDPTTSADDATPLEPDAGRRATAAGSGLPCEVAELLEAECNGCHGPRLTGGAPNRLVTYNDLATRSSDPDMTVAELSLARMRSASRPMPPEGRLAPEKVAILARWVRAELPRGRCEGETEATPPAPDPSSPPNPYAPPPPPPQPQPQPTVCTSGNTSPPSSGSQMKPGATCTSCHDFAIAGTVYPTLHEPNDCAGVGGVQIVITDANGVEITLNSNAAGNFLRRSAIALPYRAKVVRGGVERAMRTPQTEGDCNKCHTERGNVAPGRVLAP